jgi:hypothetical protein
MMIGPSHNTVSTLVYKSVIFGFAFEYYGNLLVSKNILYYRGLMKRMMTKRRKKGEQTRKSRSDLHL